MSKKIISMLIFGILTLQLITPTFQASNVETVNQEQTTRIYAPVNPTTEEVSAASPTDFVVFEDELFEKTIAQAISVNVGEITVGDMTRLTKLNLNNAEEDLTGLEYAVNLEVLWIINSEIEDMKPIQNLTKLTSLAGRFSSTDIKPVENLTNLTELSLIVDNVTNIEPIANLTKLMDLHIFANSLSDIKPIENLTGLTKLDITSKIITDITPIENLTNLTTFGINANSLSDIKPIGSLTNLTTLYIIETSVSDLTPMENLTNLSEIYFYKNGDISDLTPLRNLVNLKYITIVYSKVKDLTPLENLTNLYSLYLTNNEVTSVEPLSKLEDIRIIELSYNNISDAKPLENLTQLYTLNLSNNSIIDLSPFKKIEENNLKNCFIDVRDQDVTLPDRVVTSNEEINYTFKTLEGEEVEVQLGTPEIGVNNYEVESNMYMMADGRVRFNGTARQTIIYRELTGTEQVHTNEGQILTNEELVTLFNISSEQDKNITVDQSAVNYAVPGIYQVIFNDELDTFTGELIVDDVLPIISVTNAAVKYEIGTAKPNLVEVFGVTATELIDGDLTAEIKVDDSKVDYNAVGTYEVVFIVKDDEGTEIQTTGSFEVISSKETLPADEPIIVETTNAAKKDNNVKSEVATVTKNKAEETTNVSHKTKENKLKTTGNTTITLVLLLTAISAVLFSLKIVNNSKK